MAKAVAKAVAIHKQLIQLAMSRLPRFARNDGRINQRFPESATPALRYAPRPPVLYHAPLLSAQVAQGKGQPWHSNHSISAAAWR